MQIVEVNGVRHTITSSEDVAELVEQYCGTELADVIRGVDYEDMVAELIKIEDGGYTKTSTVMNMIEQLEKVTEMARKLAVAAEKFSDKDGAIGKIFTPFHAMAQEIYELVAPTADRFGFDIQFEEKNFEKFGREIRI